MKRERFPYFRAATPEEMIGWLMPPIFGACLACSAADSAWVRLHAPALVRHPILAGSSLAALFYLRWALALRASRSREAQRERLDPETFRRWRDRRVAWQRGLGVAAGLVCGLGFSVLAIPIHLLLWICLPMAVLAALPQGASLERIEKAGTAPKPLDR